MDPSDKSPRTQDEFEQVVEKLKSAQNVLVTISTDPTVDQFAACIGLTLVLNKVGKHANAVFSGKVPSTIDFLKPDRTLEKNTNSLRDFIIALDKSKADKLRYKVEDDVVKIFITPYKTSISEKDLEFSQGDFNVDAIVALGVQDKNHIDTAILAHGRILHDATVISINVNKQSKLGSINWNDARSSSLCEMVTDIAAELDSKVFDSQNATALLTGIVAETDRYSNDKAAPHTMSVAGLLMAAGASTQLVSSKLELGKKAEEAKSHSHHEKKKEDSKDEENGVLEIAHYKDDEPEEKPVDIPEHEDNAPKTETAVLEKPEEPADNAPKMIHEPPALGGQLTANTVGEDQRYSGSTDPLSNMPDIPMLNRDEQSSADSLLPPADDSGVAKAKDLSVSDNQTLSDIEKSVDSPHLKEDNPAGDPSPPEGLDDARSAVVRAQATLDGEDSYPEPRQDMGTTDLPAPKHLGEDTLPPESATLDSNSIDIEDLPPPPVEPETTENNGSNSSSPPPPVPPPLMPTT